MVQKKTLAVFAHLGTSQEIVWEELLQCDLFGIKWNVKL